jgi:hypothetical protein
VLAGDLNAHHGPALAEDGTTLQPRALPALLGDGALRCAYAEASGAPPGFTYLAGWSNREVKMAFDHVLLRGGVAAAAALLPPSEGDIEEGVLLPNANFPSDHLSLVVDLDFV